MSIHVKPDGQTIAAAAADIIEGTLLTQRWPRIGLATGASMCALYRELIDRHQTRSLSFAKTNAYLLDEYIGLDLDDPRAYRNVIHNDLTQHLDMSAAAVHGPDGTATDPWAEAARYERLVLAEPIDVQLLGIGSNGHIAFNEPGASLSSPTRVVTLSASTRRDNARFFSSLDEVPHHAISQGIGTISRASHLILIATGKQKAWAIAAAVEGPPTSAVPASAIQLHPNVTVLVDPDAASQLNTHDHGDWSP